MMGGGGKFRGEVVRILAPAALVVVRIMAGRWNVVEESIVPWALVKVVMTGWTMAVLVEVEMPPFASVEVMGTRIVTGVVGKAVVGTGEGVMTMLVDGGTGVFERTGGMPRAGSWTSGPFGA